MVVIGIDESYTRTGICIVEDKEILYHGSIKFKGCKTKTEKRTFLKKVIKYFTNRYNCDMIIVERVRHFSRGVMSKAYIEATAALISVVVDTAFYKNIPVFSVDTRSWKSKVVGTSKNKKGESPKQATLDFVKNKLNIQAKNDDEADAICIALYGFIEKNLQKLKKET